MIRAPKNRMVSNNIFMRKNKKVYPAIFLSFFDCLNSIYFHILTLHQYENEIHSQLEFIATE